MRDITRANCDIQSGHKVRMFNTVSSDIVINNQADLMYSNLS